MVKSSCSAKLIFDYVKYIYSKLLVLMCCSAYSTQACWNLNNTIKKLQHYAQSYTVVSMVKHLEWLFRVEESEFWHHEKRS